MAENQVQGRSPHGECGLKLIFPLPGLPISTLSLPAWGVWIEMSLIRRSRARA